MSKPPTIMGIQQKIMIKDWAMTITLQIWSSPIIDPGIHNSTRIKTLKVVPTIPDQIPEIKYNVPVSLWLVEKNHLFINKLKLNWLNLDGWIKVINCKFIHGYIILSIFLLFLYL